MRAPRGLRATVLAALVALLVAAVPAAAHIDVLPRTAVQNEAQEFTLRVPVERNVPTVAVSVDFPDEILVYSFGPAPAGWTVEPRLADDGLFEGVDFTGGAIPVNGYLDFTFLGTPFESGTAIFPARQRYADAQTKPWTDPEPEEEGAPRSEDGPTEPGPAPRVEIAAAGDPAAAGATVVTTSGDSGAGIWLGVIAIAISALALAALGFLWSTRPARLPQDD